MKKYLLGFFKYFFQRGVSFGAIVDMSSLISKKARVYRAAKVVNSSIADFSYVGPHSWLVGANVGKFCSIASNCRIGLATHSLSFLSTSPIFTEIKNATGFSWTNRAFFNPTKPVSIGNDVWIGERVIILGGLTIGNGAVVGAGAIVTKNIPAYAIAAGVPAKIIRYRFPEEQVASLEKTAWWNLSEDELRRQISVFQKPIEDFAELSPPLLDSFDNIVSFPRLSERRVA